VLVRGVAKMAAEVDETGNAIAAPYTFEARAADGTVPFSGQFLALGTRLEVMPMVPLRTPVVGADGRNTHVIDAANTRLRAGNTPDPQAIVSAEEF
jgi:hypothetical protein